jgi:hypothetical protein
MARSGHDRLNSAAPFAIVAALLLALLAVTVTTPSPARADSTIGTVTSALKTNPVYVDPVVSAELSSDQAMALTVQIQSMSSGVPLYVAVLPDTPTFNQASLLRQLESGVGQKGVYVATVGKRIGAADYAGVLRTGVASSLAVAAGRNSTTLDGALTSFVTNVNAAVLNNGRAPSGSGSTGGKSTGGASLAPVLVGVGLLAAAGGGVVAYSRKRKKQVAAQQAAELAHVKTAVDEDITAYGESLDQLEFSPRDPASTDEMRQDYAKALDQYEAAKGAAAAARRPEDMRAVTEALDEGRFALSTLAARQSGQPLPERRAPCFFDPRHGPSVEDVQWAPPGGAPRAVPACQADAIRVRDGDQPMVRQVQTSYGPQPYYNAGPAYGPWAGGYFGGGMLPALMIGTMMGSFMGGGGTYAENNYYGDGGDNGGGGWGDGGGQGGDSGGGWGDGSGGGDGGGFGGGDWGGGGDSGGGFGGGDW